MNTSSTFTYPVNASLNLAGGAQRNQRNVQGSCLLGLLPKDPEGRDRCKYEKVEHDVLPTTPLCRRFSFNLIFEESQVLIHGFFRWWGFCQSRQGNHFQVDKRAPLCCSKVDEHYTSSKTTALSET